MPSPALLGLHPGAPRACWGQAARLPGVGTLGEFMRPRVSRGPVQMPRGEAGMGGEGCGPSLEVCPLSSSFCNFFF